MASPKDSKKRKHAAGNIRAKIGRGTAGKGASSRYKERTPAQKRRTKRQTGSNGRYPGSR